jgi:hemolysin activation/secretion protein
MHHKNILAVAPALLVSMAWAQVVPPDGGVVRQQLEPPHVPALPDLQPRLTAPPVAAPVRSGGTQVAVRAIVFSGQTLLDEAALRAAVAPWVGRTLGFAELANATQAVTEAYRQAGWLARADLPPQDVTDGVVRIRITEAHFAGVTVDGAPARHLSDAQASAVVATALPAGSVVNLDKLDHALLLVNDLPGIAATLTLRAGVREGDTQAVLGLTDTPTWTGNASVDNLGARATGAVRVSAQANANSLLGIGDRAVLAGSHSEGSDYVRFAWDAPLGSRGWRAGANASWLHYRIVTPEFKALGAQGPSQSLGLQATTPLLRTRDANAALQLAADHKHFSNEANGSVTSRYDIDSISASVSGNRLDEWGDGGVSSGSAQLVGGRVDLHGSPNASADRATVHVGGQYLKLRVGANRQQRVPGDMTLVVDAQAQWTDRNVDGAEKFYLGGPAGVRAYPADEAGGSQGQLLSLELQRQASIVGMPLTFSAFTDYGHVTVNTANRFPGAPALNGYGLAGAGAWVGTTLPAALADTQLRLTWAHRIGQNAGASAQGRDQDGSKALNRFWLTASAAF